MRILIVEDDTLTALNLMCSLQDAGHQVIGPASTAREASTLIDDSLDFAFVDVDLDYHEAGLAIAESLAHARVPVIFTTAQPERAKACGTGLGVFTKPYSAIDAANVLACVENRSSGKANEIGTGQHAAFEWLAVGTRPSPPFLLVDDPSNDIELLVAAPEAAQLPIK